MVKSFLKILAFFLLSNSLIFSQEITHDVEIFIIDAFVTPEIPHTFKLTFFTDEKVKSKLVLDQDKTFPVSDKFTEDHSAEIDLSNYEFKQKEVTFYIEVEDTTGNKIISEESSIILPYERFIETKEGSNPIMRLCIGGTLFLLPSVSYVKYEGKNYLGLNKEFPLLTIYSSGYNYPNAIISLEYSHILKAPVKNFLRIGYKYLIQPPVIEFISPGLTAYTNFLGYNGLGGELSVGLFKIFDVFTLYGRYRFNIQPSNSYPNIHEISLGLFSHFFSIDF